MGIKPGPPALGVQTSPREVLQALSKGTRLHLKPWRHFTESQSQRATQSKASLCTQAPLVAQLVQNPPAKQETRV